MEKRVVVYLFVFLGIFAYFYFLDGFLEENFVWVLAVFFYVIGFAIYNQSLKRKDFEKQLKIKNRDEIRINFWK